MGQQQLLLIILGVIVVGIAVIVGITMFQDNAISANRDAVVNDLVNLGARAQQFYRRPLALGGGGNSFVGCTIDKLAGPVGGGSWINPNGTYTVEGTPTATEINLKGLGTEKSAGNPVQVTSKVTPDSLVTTVVN